MAVTITAANVAFGMNLKVAVSDKADMTKTPVKRPPKGVLTPEALFTAVRVKEPAVGMDRANDPKILQAPKAIISCVASKVFPFAVTFEKIK